MNIDDDIHRSTDPGFAALRSALDQHHAPRGVEKELMDAFARQFPPRRWYHMLTPVQWRIAGGVGGAALLAVLALAPGSHVRPNVDAAPGSPLVSVDEGLPFIALESAERIAQEPDARMLETEVPRTSLTALGVPVTPENAGESVRAELLVGADGSALALRLVAMP